jgi:hypothetical protein
MAALIAGVSGTLLAGIAVVYLPTAFGQVTPILFELGAITVAKYPNGIMTENARQIRRAWDKVQKASGPREVMANGDLSPTGAASSASSEVGGPTLRPAMTDTSRASPT